LAGATARVSARATGVFTEGHQRFWDTARRKAGEDRDGTKALIGGAAAAPHPSHRGGARRDRRSGGPAGRCDPDLVAVEVPVDTWTVDGPPRWVPDVPGGRLGVDDRPVPLDGYDDLLQPRA
jgi:hypothetical protein